MTKEVWRVIEGTTPLGDTIEYQVSDGDCFTRGTSYDFNNLKEAREYCQQLNREEYQNETNIQKTNNNTSNSNFSDTIFFSKGVNRMNCWHCQTELIWGGDHDLEDEEDYIMVTNLSCPKCKSHVDVYYPREGDN